jgi:membrane protease YdiL (CAAX protease family)
MQDLRRRERPRSRRYHPAEARMNAHATTRRDRWITAAAWAAILAACAYFATEAAENGPENAAAGAHAQWEMIGRAAVGMHHALGTPASSSRAVVDTLDKGAVELRQRAAIVAGEIEGPQSAQERLAAIDVSARAAGGTTAEVERVLFDLYPASPPKDETPAARVGRLSPDDRALLAKSLGWFGRLALAPDGGDAAARDAVMSAARRTTIVNGAFVGAACALIPAGLVLLLVALVQTLRGKLVARHDVAPDERTFGAETFAAYLALFVAFSVAAREWAPAEGRVVATLCAQAASFAALGVALSRGVPWATLRRRVGLTTGAGLVREIAAGVVGWIACVPIVSAGVVVALAVPKLLGHERAPGEGGHPIVTFLQNAPPGDALLIVVAATVMAPLLEETMFRGVLYRHLRESTATWPRAASVLAGAAVVSLLFAAVHPQGWTGVPVLGALAFSFAIVREWRGSLVASMTMHCITNTVAVVAMRVALS